MLRSIERPLAIVLLAAALACGPESTKPVEEARPVSPERSTAQKPTKPIGKRSYALWFDGRDDFLRTGKWLSGIQSDFCIEAWIKPTLVNPYSGSAAPLLLHSAPGHERYLELRLDGYAVGFGGNQPPGRTVWLTQVKNLSREGWRHVAVVCQGTSATLYVDGSQVAQTRVPHAFDWDSGFAGSFIGGHPLPGVLSRKYFRGQIDEVRIWNRARTVEEIRAAVNRSVPADSPGLSAYWNFDDTDAQLTRDVSGHGLDAHFGATPGPDPSDPIRVRSDCPIDGSADVGPAGCLALFDGEDDRVQCASIPALRGAKALTVEAWIRPPSPLRRACLVAAQQSPDARDLSLWQNADGSLELAVRTAGGSRSCRSKPALQPGVWQHVAVVYDGRIVSMRVDGKPVHEETWNVPPAFSGTPVMIGAAGDGKEPFSGEMDELRIWSVARSEREIRDAMTANVAPGQSGLAAYWRFDEGGGQIVRDWSSSVAHAMWGVSTVCDVYDPLWLVSDAPVKVKAVAPPPSMEQNGALEFDGLDDFVDLGNAPELHFTTAVTAEAWIRPDSVQKEIPIVAKANARGRQNAIELQVKDGLVRFRISDGKAECCGDQGWWPVAGKTPIEPGLWHHVAGTYDGKQVCVYVDGVMQASSAFDKTIADVPFAANLGMDSIVQPKYFRGQIDELRLWDRARSQVELYATMNTTLCGHEPGLVGYWTFDEPFEAGQTSPTCQVAIDHSGRNNHGVFGQSIVNPETRDPRWVVSGAPILPAPPDEEGM